MKKYVSLALCMLGAAQLFSAPAGRPVPTVSVAVARPIAVSAVKEYIGKISAGDEVDLFARVTGVLLKQNFKDGDHVKKGQLLFVLEDTTYRAKAETARANLKQSEAELRYSQSNLKRNTTLRGQKAVSESNYEEAVRLNASNEAKVAACKAALLDAENDLSYTRIYSPVDGRAGAGTFSEGNLITPSSPSLVNITTCGSVNVYFSLSEQDFLSLFGSRESLRKNADVRLILPDGTLYPLAGTITFIDNKVDPTTDTLRMRAKFADPEDKLIPGGLPTVRLSRKSKGTLAAIRPSALVFDSKGIYIYVLNDKNVAERRAVKLGVLFNNWQTIVQGLKAGERVVVDGTHKVVPGQPVKPISVKEE